jgi:hypothetical protein
MVTSSDAFTGANFRRGSSLDHADRYRRAEEEFLTMARQFWDSWVCDVDTGIYVEPSRIRAVEHHGTRFDVRGVTALRAGAAATLTPCSRCTRRWRPGSVITLMSKARIRRHRRSGRRQTPAHSSPAGQRATAIAMLEQVWGHDLCDYDPDGALPDIDPTRDTSTPQGRVPHGNPVGVTHICRETR